MKKAKLEHVLQEAIAAFEVGNFYFSKHALERLQERKVIRREVKEAVYRGYHEKNRDRFDKTYNTWNYSIRGKTIDSRELRIIISFLKNRALIITVIELEEAASV